MRVWIDLYANMSGVEFLDRCYLAQSKRSQPLKLVGKTMAIHCEQQPLEYVAVYSVLFYYLRVC